MDYRWMLLVTQVGMSDVALAQSDSQCYALYRQAGAVPGTPQCDLNASLAQVGLATYYCTGTPSIIEAYCQGEPACSVPPLTPITDEEAKRFENGANVDTEDLQPNMRTALDCVQNSVTAAHGTVTVTSAYRPPAYQVHLREVWDKWRRLRDNADQRCRELRDTVSDEFHRHKLKVSQICLTVAAV